MLDDEHEKAYELLKSEVKKADENLDRATIERDYHFTDHTDIIEKLRNVKDELPNNPRPYDVATLLMKYILFVKIVPKTATETTRLLFYNPNDGVYLENDERLKDYIGALEPNFNEKRANDTLYILKRQVKEGVENQEYTSFGNCLYNSETEEVREFTPSIITTRKIATNYNDRATEPIIDGWTPSEWLTEVFSGDEELTELFYQVLRACITGKTHKKIYWLYGEGGTGKGTIQELISNVIGLDNIASIKVTDLDGNKGGSQFITAQAIGKSVIIGDDIQMNAVIKDTSVMFSIATGDIISVERKGKDRYSARLNVVVIQSSNGFPRMNGDTYAIQRRFVVVPFTGAFKGKPNKKIKDDYIKRKEVREWLLLEALRRKYLDITPKVSTELLEEFQEEINPILSFAKEFFTDDLESTFLPNDFVFHCFQGFLDNGRNKMTVSAQGFHKELQKYLPLKWTKGVKAIPRGQQLASGFFPKEDTPSYARKDKYIHFRASKSPQTTERGYIRKG